MAKIRTYQAHSRLFQVHFSMLEIYNEKVRDLLNQAEQPKQGLPVRMSQTKGFYGQFCVYLFLRIITISNNVVIVMKEILGFKLQTFRSVVTIFGGRYLELSFGTTKMAAYANKIYISYMQL